MQTGCAGWGSPCTPGNLDVVPTLHARLPSPPLPRLRSHQLLRGVRRHPRRAAEPPDGGAHPGGHGAALQREQRGGRAAAQAAGAGRAARPPGRQRRAGPVPRLQRAGAQGAAQARRLPQPDADLRRWAPAPPPAGSSFRAQAPLGLGWKGLDGGCSQGHSVASDTLARLSGPPPAESSWSPTGALKVTDTPPWLSQASPPPQVLLGLTTRAQA